MNMEEFEGKLSLAAENNQIFCSFRNYVDGSHNNRYMVLTTDTNKFIDLLNHPEIMCELVDDLETKGRDEVLLDYALVDITDAGDENSFRLNQEACRQIQRMAVAKNCFHECGYELPHSMPGYMIDSIWELDQMRSNRQVPAALRGRYREAYDQAVAQADRIYNRMQTDLLKKYPFDFQRMDDGYFIDHHVGLVWESIDEPEWQFLRQEMKNHPDFRYCRQQEVCRVVSPANHAGAEAADFWKEEEKKECQIVFPVGQQDMFYAMRNEYQTRSCRQKIPVQDLKGMTDSPLQVTYVGLGDMHNWDQLCESEGLHYAVDHGEHVDITADSARYLPVLYRIQDAKTVGTMQEHLAQKTREYRASSREAVERAKENGPRQQRENPYLLREEELSL